MEPEHKERIRRNFCTLLDRLNMDDAVQADFLRTGLFTEYMLERIQMAGGRRDRIVEMLLMLPKRGPQAFQLFTGALNRTGQTELAALL